VTRATISLVEFERYEQATQATIRRLQAENTWLRHHHGELEARVLQLKRDMAAIRRAANEIRKSLGIAPAKTTQTRRSK
jgi:hypothetical protein